MESTTFFDNLFWHLRVCFSGLYQKFPILTCKSTSSRPACIGDQKYFTAPSMTHCQSYISIQNTWYVLTEQKKVSSLVLSNTNWCNSSLFQESDLIFFLMTLPLAPSVLFPSPTSLHQLWQLAGALPSFTYLGETDKKHGALVPTFNLLRDPPAPANGGGQTHILLWMGGELLP